MNRQYFKTEAEESSRVAEATLKQPTTTTNFDGSKLEKESETITKPSRVIRKTKYVSTEKVLGLGAKSGRVWQANNCQLSFVNCQLISIFVL